MIISNKKIDFGANVKCPICESEEYVVIESYTTSVNAIYAIGSRYPIDAEPRRTTIEARCACGASFTTELMNDRIVGGSARWNRDSNDMGDSNRYYGD